MRPCWWFEYCDNYGDLLDILDLSDNLTPFQIVQSLRDAVVRAKVFKPRIAPAIQYAIDCWDKQFVRPPRPPQPKKVYALGMGNFNFPKVKLHLSEEDVWTGSSTWWHQAAKIRQQVKYGNPY